MPEDRQQRALFIGIRWEACQSFVRIMQNYGYAVAVVTLKGTQVEARVSELENVNFLGVVSREKKSALAVLENILVSGAYRCVLSSGFPFIIPPVLLQQGPVFINSHPHLLPEYKGINAIRESISAGVREFGVTTHVMSPEVDAGDILVRRRISFMPDTDKDRADLYQLLFAFLEPAAVAETMALLRERGVI